MLIDLFREVGDEDGQQRLGHGLAGFVHVSPRPRPHAYIQTQVLFPSTTKKDTGPVKKEKIHADTYA
jgi:hypothetical protein